MAKKFKTPAELINAINNNNIKYAKSSGNSALANMTEEILISAADDLRDNIIANINSWYDHYSSHPYHSTWANWDGRTKNWAKSLDSPVAVTTSDGGIKVELRWNDLAWHDSVYQGGDRGFVPWLFEIGWSHRRSRGVPMFDFFRGEHIVLRAAAKTKRKFGFGIRIMWNGEVY